MFLTHPSWKSYLITGTIALTLSMVFSGCRFGNRAEETPQKEFTFEYFDTEPARAYFCPVLEGEDTPPTCPEGDVGSIPADVAGTMSNPVAIAKHPDLAYSLLVHWETTQNLPIFHDPDDSLSVLDEYLVGFADGFADTSCVSLFSRESKGAIERYAAPKTSVVGISTLGRLGLTITTMREFDSSCANTLQALADCYQNENSCPGDTAALRIQNRATVTDFFEPYVTYGGISPAQIAELKKIVYQAVYE